jgi:hypothetical protein
MSEPDAWDPGSPPNRERTQEYQRQARHLLMELDPIGVSDTPEAVGEYDCMIGPLLHRMSRSVTPLITRFTAVVTALAGAVPAFGAAAPAAFALCRGRNQAALATPLRS